MERRMERHTLMPPLPSAPRTWDTETTSAPPPRPAADTIAMCRKMYGDTATLDALAAANGDAREANRTLRRELQRSLRAAKRAERRAKRTDEVLYNGPVEIGPRLRAVIDGGREVKCEMGGGRRIRATYQGLITTPDGTETAPNEAAGYGPGNIIVLYDPRIGTKQATAEVVWTGSDYRIHIWRRSPLDTRSALPLDISDAT